MSWVALNQLDATLSEMQAKVQMLEKQIEQ